MNPKFIIIGTIVLTAGTMGMLGAGTVVWYVMSHRIVYDQFPNQPTPQPSQGEQVPVRVVSGGIGHETASSRSVIFNGQRITQEEFAALMEGNDDLQDQPLPQAANSSRLPATPPPVASLRSVFVNGQQISDRDLAALELQNRSRIPTGRYWYDRISGAWGTEGGPCEGFIAAGMSVGGPLRSDASNGDTGVFINGRQIHRRDLAALQQLGPVFRGRYWVDAQANWGIEGGPMMGNLKVAAAQVAQRAGNGSGGGNGGSWMHRSSYTDSGAGGDGETFYYIDKNSSYISSH